jgi:hypothetical protein
VKEERSLLQAVLRDGRFLIALTGISLALSGGFAILQPVSGQLLPHDSHALGMDSIGLIHAGNRHLLGFMFHDRVAYGGSLLAIGAGYLWLVNFPMSTRAAWAWWALVFSGGIGFLAFLTYLGQGYRTRGMESQHCFFCRFLRLDCGVLARTDFRFGLFGPLVPKARMFSPGTGEFFWERALWASFLPD